MGRRTAVMKRITANQQAAAYHFHHPLHTFRIPSRALGLGPVLYMCLCMHEEWQLAEYLSPLENTVKINETYLF
jgi:hypothetical protein